MAELEEGRVIGSSYRVVRCIGQGGMGTVYEVEHVELGVHYALKTFTFDPTNDASHALKTKFLEEGKVLARLKHPNIAHVFDLAFDEETQMPYFVMDLVTYEDGESYTAEDVDPNDIDEEVVYGWFKELASALDYIHEQGIVHRDIKPGNLLMDKDAHVILTDFGISRIFGERLKTDVDATKTMVSKTGRGKLVLGTENYIAPEVERGEEAVPESDAYSLGVMVLRWLTGFFYKDNPGALGLLGQKEYHWLPVIARLLAPTPDRRPKTYSDLVKQLKPIANGRAASTRPPQESAEQKAKKKRNTTRENIIAAVAGLFIVAVLAAGGYFAWQYVEKKGAERDRQVAELKKQMAADKAAAEKKEAEEKAEAERKAAEEKRIAAEKEAARKAKIAERERLEAARTKIERQDPSTLAVRETPKSAEVKPEPEKPKEEFIVVKDETPEEDTKNYGPIPNKKYTWLKGGNAKFPQEVKFRLANGDMIEMLPIRAGTFFMSNEPTTGKRWHKVTITRPFWMSKFCVTANQWREYAPDDCDDCKQIEAALKNKYPVSKLFDRKTCDLFCLYLTKKYASQLPKGYVFRIPTEAEWEYAFDVDATRIKYDKYKGLWWGEYVRIQGQYPSEQLKRLSKCELASFGDLGRIGFIPGKSIFIGGRTMPNAHGIIDIDLEHNRVLDIVKKNTTVQYPEEEADPISYVSDTDIWSGGNCELVRRGEQYRHYWGAKGANVFHVVLAPDLIAEKNWRLEKQVEKAEIANLPKKNYPWALEKIPAKLSKPIEIKFKLISGEDMIFCACPKGRYKMSNVPGQDQKFHRVEISSPFYITKYCVTTKQWREWSKYDYEGASKDAEKIFAREGWPMCVSANKWAWDKYCEFLTARYRSQLPPGYVFRLPTEAELEWVMVGKQNGSVDEIDDPAKYDRWNKALQNDIVTYLRKKKVPQSLGVNEGGHLGSCFVGGRTAKTKWGVYDVAEEAIVFDTCEEYAEMFWNEGVPEKWLHYSEGAIDPVSWSGMLANKYVARYGMKERRLRPFNLEKSAHIVIAPEIEPALKQAELAPYATEKFGGKLITSSRVCEQSSKYGPWNTEAHYRIMLSNESVMKRIKIDDEDFHSIHTKQEDAPWVDIELNEKPILTGIQIDVIHAPVHAQCLRIWVSDDRKQWREVYADEMVLQRREIPIKNIKAKYVRVGRKRGFNHDFFSVDKILIYGKAK